MQEVAHVAMITPCKKVIMVVRRDGSYGFLGGKVDETDRNLQHTIIRETKEEIGVKISQTVPLRHMMKRPLKKTMISHFFVMDNLSLNAAKKMVSNFKVNEEIRAVKLIDTKQKNALELLKSKDLAYGVEHQLDVLFESVL